MDNGKITWTNESRKLSELIPWPRNPRQIKVDQVKRLQESLDEFGQPETIAIGPGNEIYNGHQRLKSWADKFGDIEVDVRVSDRALTEKEREKLTIFLHKGAAGEFDFDALANNFEIDDLLDWGFSEMELEIGGYPFAEEVQEDDPGAQIDRAEELRELWGVETGQLWRLGEHQIYCGDCTSRMDSEIFLPEQIDMIFSDPPYGVAVNVATKDGRQLQGDLSMAAIPASFVLTFDRLIPGGWVYMCGGWTNAPLWFRLFDVHCHMIPRLIVWDKGEFVFRRSGYHAQYELIYVGWKQGGGHRNDHWYGDRKQTDIWAIRYESDDRDVNHPTTKPVELVEIAISNSCPPNGLVYDPFLGSGTTLVACERLGRKCRAVEISPAYCAVAIQRWVDMTGGEPELVEPVIQVETGG